MTGPNPKKIWLTFGLLNIASFFYAVFPLRYFADRERSELAVIGFLLIGLSNFLLFWMSLGDPGFIPRSQKINPVERSMAVEKHTRLIVGASGLEKLKFCETCNIWRPPRTVHCSLCDACIRKMDHHCQWIGSCVGVRNYTKFIAFATCVTFFCCFVFFSSIQYFYLMIGDEMSKGQT
jgi:palmitoyltransferase ZDHHC9/14/18